MFSAYMIPSWDIFNYFYLVCNKWPQAASKVFEHQVKLLVSIPITLLFATEIQLQLLEHENPHPNQMRAVKIWL